MVVTKREAMVSVIIVVVMLTIGMFISNAISNIVDDEIIEYKRAIQINNDTEMFKHCMVTNAGIGLVYGELSAVDTVSYDDVSGEFMYIRRTEEHYNMHTMVVTDIDSNGVTHSRTEVYYSWDYYDSDDKHSENVLFCGVEFPYEKISIPRSEYIGTVNVNKDVRYIYKGVSSNHIGTIYTLFSNNTISDNSMFIEDEDVESALSTLCSKTKSWKYIFWFLWIVLTAGLVCGFCYLENEWIEDNVTERI